MSNFHGMIRSAYTFDSDAVSNETALDCGDESVTQQYPMQSHQKPHQDQTYKQNEPYHGSIVTGKQIGRAHV